MFSYDSTRLEAPMIRGRCRQLGADHDLHRDPGVGEGLADQRHRRRVRRRVGQAGQRQARHPCDSQRVSASRFESVYTVPIAVVIDEMIVPMFVAVHGEVGAAAKTPRAVHAASSVTSAYMSAKS